MPVLGNDLAGKIFKNGLLGQIPGIIIIWQSVNHTYKSIVFPELSGYGLADSFCAAGNDGSLILKHFLSPPENSIPHNLRICHRLC